MRTPGTAEELERRRRLAVARVLEGHTQQEVATFLGVAKSAVSQWMKAYRERGTDGLAAKPVSGRPCKLTKRQENCVLRWFHQPATKFGFANDLWTAPRVARLIKQKWGVDFHPRYLNAWLAERRITPQKPRSVPRERDDEKINHWLRYRWPRIKNPKGIKSFADLLQKDLRLAQCSVEATAVRDWRGIESTVSRHRKNCGPLSIEGVQADTMLTTVALVSIFV